MTIERNEALEAEVAKFRLPPRPALEGWDAFEKMNGDEVRAALGEEKGDELLYYRYRFRHDIEANCPVCGKLLINLGCNPKTLMATIPEHSAVKGWKVLFAKDKCPGAGKEAPAK